MKPFSRSRPSAARAVALALACVVAFVCAPTSRIFAQATYDVAVRVVAFPHRVQAGDQVRFRVTAKNRGPGTSRPFKIVLTSAGGIQVDMVLGKPGVVVPVAADRIEVRYSQGLEPNDLADINIPSTVTGAAGTQIRIHAILLEEPPSGDVVRENNSDQFITTIRPPNSPDLGVRIVDSPDPVTTGDTITYTIGVANRAAVPLDGVTLTTLVPEDTWFGSLTTTQGTATTPIPSGTGPISVDIGTLAPEAVVTISLRVSVTAEPRSLVVLPVEVSDGADRSRSAGEMTFVVAEGDLFLAWMSPDAQLGDLAPPRQVRFERARRGGNSRADAPVDMESLLAAPETASVTTYKVYSSSQPGVSTSPSNIFASVPPNQSSSGSVATTSGNYYVATACYANGESATSNEVSAGAGEPALETFAFTDKKITVTGTGFTDAVTVTIDGIAFEKVAEVKKKKTKIVQKGKLSNGQTIGDYVTPGRTVFLCYENETGATTCVAVMRQ
jgi:uncharacterized repeat protein (TIGR01451 family)